MTIFTNPVDYSTANQAMDFLDAQDPFALFDAWYADAREAEINDPNAMAVATVDETGLPNVRVVLLKGLDGADTGPDRGFVFYTNLQSQKGREILDAGLAASNFHWKSLRRQVRLRGTVSQVSDAEADAYFNSRPRDSRIGAWASQQSQTMPDRDALKRAFAEIEARHEGEEIIPRPPHWSGLRIVPIVMEFWHDRPYRLHDRLIFKRLGREQPWTREQFYP
ncbi:MAG: pyridoxamine 5'-phosphate oxidase [Pseudomonadota bacterium]